MLLLCCVVLLCAMPLRWGIAVILLLLDCKDNGQSTHIVWPLGLGIWTRCVAADQHNADYRRSTASAFLGAYSIFKCMFRFGHTQVWVWAPRWPIKFLQGVCSLEHLTKKA